MSIESAEDLAGMELALKDGWTVRTRDRSLAAHYEHTVVVVSDGARLLTD